MRRVVVFGTGAFAEVACFYLEHDSRRRVAALAADGDFLHRARASWFFNLPVVAFDEVEAHYPPHKFDMFIAVGYSSGNRTRAEKYLQAKKKGYRMATYVSPKTVNWCREIGDNCFIFENQTIQPFTKIGSDVVMWSGNHVGHHSKIGDHCFISSHVVISGNVEIGPYCFLGVNSTIVDGVKIAGDTTVGAGAVVVEDIDEPGVYVGNPARRIR